MTSIRCGTRQNEKHIDRKRECGIFVKKEGGDGIKTPFQTLVHLSKMYYVSKYWLEFFAVDTNWTFLFGMDFREREVTNLGKI